MGGEWRNVSKFKPVDLPERGARVRLELDAKGFIRTLLVLDAAPAPSSSMSPTRDREIRRMSALRSAAVFVGHYSTVHEEVRSADVLKIAEAFEHWLEREEEG